MAYGTPATPDDVEAYYTHVRRGRPPPPDLLADLRRRYDAIGGTSPLLERTRAQAAGVQAALGPGFKVELGMKHAPPFIEDGVARLAAAGIREAVGAVLAPHYSVLSVGEYAARVRATPPVLSDTLGMTFVESWHLAPDYIELLRGLLEGACRDLGAAPTHVLFTAHSLPARILEAGDPYPQQLRETAEAVAAAAGIDDWSIAWQSAGRTADPWIGPDVLEVLPELAARGYAGVVVCPAGFVSDHLEVLYDLDIEAAAAAEKVGLRFGRTGAPNDHPLLCRAVAAAIREARG
ncbi:MAG: ferrochelatase [Actinomycetota bacterium]|nr:ferrochelatase [Actinomycetota bacterium]